MAAEASPFSVSTNGPPVPVNDGVSSVTGYNTRIKTNARRHRAQHTAHTGKQKILHTHMKTNGQAFPLLYAHRLGRARLHHTPVWELGKETWSWL